MSHHFEQNNKVISIVCKLKTGTSIKKKYSPKQFCLYIIRPIYFAFLSPVWLTCALEPNICLHKLVKSLYTIRMAIFMEIIIRFWSFILQNGKVRCFFFKKNSLNLLYNKYVLNKKTLKPWSLKW